MEVKRQTSSQTSTQNRSHCGGGEGRWWEKGLEIESICAGVKTCLIRRTLSYMDVNKLEDKSCFLRLLVP